MPKIHILNKHHNKEPTDMKTFYIGRGSPVGNPFSHLYSTPDEFLCIDRLHAIYSYKPYFIKQFKESAEFRNYLKTMLDELNLGNDIGLLCYCSPLECHGDVIKRVLENQLQIIKNKQT